ncbi:MAG: M23 family metallopeptidase [Rhizomicrobium sp.]
MKLPPVEQRRLAPPPVARQAEASNTSYTTPKPKPHNTPGWYGNYSQSSQSASQSNDLAPVQTADAKFVWPLKGRVILGYGRGEGSERNDGINIAAIQGAPVRAAASGTISYCGNELKGYGNLVLIKHDNGYITAYAHVDSFLVGRDDRVAAGQVIAYVGSTGDVTSPQLHFEIRRGVQPVNPQALLPKSMVVASN